MTRFTGRKLVNRARDEDFEAITDKGLAGQPDEASVCLLLSRELTAAENVMVGMARLLPGQYHLKHHHPGGAEFFVVTRGSAIFFIGTDEIRGDYRTAIYIPRNTIHAIKNDTGDVCELVWGFDRPSFEEAGNVYDE